ncbi:MAG: hypothetical protein M3O34_11800, partial [Chloroflexota bacterium]|nr:hypothetical protein [Chloroflexota bacterium]
EIGLTGATTAPMTVAEQAAALDGLAWQVRETEAGEATDGLEAAIRAVVDERATGLEYRLRAALGAILESGVNRWDPARALVRGAVVAGSEFRTPSTARSPGEGAGQGAQARAGVAGAEAPECLPDPTPVAAPELAWPERPGEHLLRLGEAGASRPALTTFTLLLMAGVFWATLGLGPLLSAATPWTPIAGLLALLVVGVPLLVDRRAQDRLRRRYLAALRERALAWTAALPTWGGTVYAPTRLRSATTGTADLLKQTWRAWAEARARAVHAAETARRTWFESASSHVASPLRGDELDQAVILMLQEADARHCAERALRRLAEQPGGPDSQAGRDLLTLAPEAIWRAHRAEADAHLRPLAEATVRDFDEYIVSIWPRLEDDLTTVARRLAGAGGREHVFVFVPDRLTLDVAAGPARPHYVPAPDDEIGALVLARPRQALLELRSPEYPLDIVR